MMKRKLIIPLIFGAMILGVSRPSYATIDMAGMLQNLYRVIQSIQEVLQNVKTIERMTDVKTIMGDAGSSFGEIDLESQLDYESFAPVTTNDIASIISQGKKAIPDMRNKAKELLDVPLENPTEYYQKHTNINKRLNVSGLETAKLAKSMEALSNKGASEAKSQLKNFINADDLMAKQEENIGHKDQSIKREVGVNVLYAKQLEALAAKEMFATSAISKDKQKQKGESK